MWQNAKANKVKNVFNDMGSGARRGLTYHALSITCAEKFLISKCYETAKDV